MRSAPPEAPVALVTGGANGIGRAVAIGLRERTSRVVVADTDREALVLLREHGVEGECVDATDRCALATLVDGLDVAPQLLVTCAGGAPRSKGLDIDAQLFCDTLSLNTCAYLWSAQAVARRLLRESWPGSFVHVASSLYQGPAPELAHFAAAKAASVTLVRCLADELAPHDIRVNAVLPGLVETQMTLPIFERRPEFHRAAVAATRRGRLGLPQDIAAAIIYLLSDEADWVTGTLLRVDGGLSVTSQTLGDLRT